MSTPSSARLLPLALVAAFAAAPVFAGGGKDIDKVMGSITAHSGAQYGDLSSVNGSIRVEAGATAQEVSTVNGSVHLETGARTGDAGTVNGSIRMDDKAEAGDVETVNGSIRLGENARARGIQTVNGSVFTDRGSNVGKGIETVNGAIGLVDTDLGGSIATVNGDITVGVGSHVRGGITVEKPTNNWSPVSLKSRKPRIVIAPHAVVDGPLVFKREVVLYVHETARIGPVTGATAVRYSGDRAPKE